MEFLDWFQVKISTIDRASRRLFFSDPFIFFLIYLSCPYVSGIMVLQTFFIFHYQDGCHYSCLIKRNTDWVPF